MLSVTTGYSFYMFIYLFFCHAKLSPSENPWTRHIDQRFLPSSRLLFSHTAFHNKNKTKLPMCAYYDKFPRHILYNTVADMAVRFFHPIIISVCLLVFRFA